MSCLVVVRLHTEYPQQATAEPVCMLGLISAGTWSMESLYTVTRHLPFIWAQGKTFFADNSLLSLWKYYQVFKFQKFPRKSCSFSLKLYLKHMETIFIHCHSRLLDHMGKCVRNESACQLGLARAQLSGSWLLHIYSYVHSCI